jgi:hypothetical protein
MTIQKEVPLETLYSRDGPCDLSRRLTSPISLICRIGPIESITATTTVTATIFRTGPQVVPEEWSKPARGGSTSEKELLSGITIENRLS